MLAEAGCTLPEIVSITRHTQRRAQGTSDRYLARTASAGAPNRRPSSVSSLRFGNHSHASEIVALTSPRRKLPIHARHQPRKDGATALESGPLATTEKKQRAVLSRAFRPRHRNIDEGNGLASDAAPIPAFSMTPFQRSNSADIRAPRSSGPFATTPNPT